MTIYNQHTTFARGEVGDSLYDTQNEAIRGGGCSELRNWFVDTTGAAIRRPGFEYLVSGEVTGPDVHIMYVEFRNWEILVMFFRTFEGDIEIQYLDLQDINAAPVVLYTAPAYNFQTGLRLTQLITHAQFGPSVFFASEMFPPLRLFFQPEFFNPTALAPVVEEVIFYEELFGLTTGTQFSQAWVGQDTIYTSQLSSGDIILFRGNLYTVDTVTDDNNFTTLEFYDDLTFTGSLAVQRDTSGKTPLTGIFQTPDPFTNVVTGFGTLFTTELNVGDQLELHGQVRVITTITDDENLTVNQAYGNIPVFGVNGFLVNTDSPFYVGFPKFVAVYQGRLIYAGNNGKPTGIWASKPNDPFVLLGAGVNDDSPINVELIADGLDEIRWMTAQDRLYLGGDEGEYALGTPDEPMVPANVGVRKLGSTGNARVPAIAVGTDVYHINIDQGQLFFTRFDEQLQNFQSDDLSALAPHLLEDGAVQLLFQNTSPSDKTQRFWVKTNSNQMATLALAPRNDVVAWTPLELGGPHNVFALATSPKDVFILSIDANEPERYYLLRMAQPDLPYALDYAHSFSPQNAVQTVPEVFWGYTVLAVSQNKGVLGAFPVSDTGELDLTEVEPTEELGQLTIGYYFKGTMTLLPVQDGDQKGSLLSRKRRLVRAIVSVRNTSQLMVNGQPLMGALGNTIGSDISPQNGRFPVRFLGWGLDDTLTVETANAYPAKVLSIVREIGS